MGGGAWPFLVGGVICLVNSVNERDLSLLNSHANLLLGEAGGRLVGLRARRAVPVDPGCVRRRLLRGTILRLAIGSLRQ